MFTPTGKLCLIFATLVVITALILGLSGCTRMMELDRTIWTPITQTPEETQAGKPPPLLEVIAGALATIGFCGMALWIRRNKKRACTTADVETIVKNNNSPA